MQRFRDYETGSGQMLARVSADRLQDLLSTVTTLRRDGQLLIDQIRRTLTEMRQLRSQLREQRGPSRAATNGRGPAYAAYIQMRYGLTAREMEVATLLARGRSNSAIAETLGISTHTARHHTQRILTKLEVHSRAEAGAKLRA
jgi:DNA-binding NarL/FixJ family response regulator